MGHTNHSDAGPNRNTTAAPTPPSAMPNRKSTKRNGTSSRPYEANERPNTADASTSMTRRPTALVAMLERTRPARYSEIFSGEAKKLRKLRDHTSSRKAVVTPCVAREKKSQSSTAPRSAGTKL